jgi:hypothetical protein
MSDIVPFAVECPRCHQERMQGAYSRDELQQLLSSGAEIEALCVSCDRPWLISVEERADLEQLLRQPLSTKTHAPRR